MGMSVDTSQLENVAQFAAFVEFISNPNKVKETLANVQATTADYTKKLGLITTKEQADRYLEQARVVLDEANVYLAKEKAKQDAAAAQVIADLTAKKTEMERTLEVLSKRQAEADSNFKESERLRTEANALFASASKREEILSGKEADLAAFAAKLNEKQAKLNQLLG